MVDKAGSKALRCRLIIISGRSVNWWDEELCQLVKDLRDCFAHCLGNDRNWNNYLHVKIQRE